MSTSTSLDASLEKAVTTAIPRSPVNDLPEQKEIAHKQDELLRLEMFKEQIEDIKHFRDLRRLYARMVFLFMCVWSGLMFATLLFDGVYWFDLSDTVLVTLAGGTTISVVGLVGFIVQGLFNSKRQ